MMLNVSELYPGRIDGALRQDSQACNKVGKSKVLRVGPCKLVWKKDIRQDNISIRSAIKMPHLGISCQVEESPD